jgi:hypothetical protein
MSVPDEISERIEPFKKSSDGYADQFGGPKGKKFRYGPFKELLARVHTMSPEEQKKELDRVFEEWRGDRIRPTTCA